MNPRTSQDRPATDPPSLGCGAARGAPSLPLSRRRFLGVVGAGAGAMIAGVGGPDVLGAGRGGDNLRLGMMLQGGSSAELHERAKDVAAAGFERVQVTFFFRPKAEELLSLSRRLKELNLETVAFGTYFNLFRPDDTGFMGACQEAMRTVAAHAHVFGCKQFVTWSASYSPRFDGVDPRNHTPETVAQVHRAIRQVVLPILESMDGRVAFEPYFPHVLGSPELAKAILDPFPARRVGLLCDPPNFITPELYPKRDEELRRLLHLLGKRIHVVHLKDLKLNPSGQSVDLPGPGAGEMNYPLLISGLRKLHRPIPCIIEHIKAETAEMARTKAWVEQQLSR